MCLGIPGRVIQTDSEHGVLMGRVDFGGVPDADIGQAGNADALGHVLGDVVRHRVDIKRLARVNDLLSPDRPGINGLMAEPELPRQGGEEVVLEFGDRLQEEVGDGGDRTADDCPQDDQPDVVPTPEQLGRIGSGLPPPLDSPMPT